MKKLTFAIAALSSLLFTACGNDKSSSSDADEILSSSSQDDMYDPDEDIPETESSSGEGISSAIDSGIFSSSSESASPCLADSSKTDSSVSSSSIGSVG
jgi:hypothetical protein